MINAVKKKHNANVTLENSSLGVFYSFRENVRALFLALAKGLETNKEPAPYTNETKTLYFEFLYIVLFLNGKTASNSALSHESK